MSKSFFRQFQNEDWIATLMGLLLIVTVIVLPGLIPVFPKELNTVEAWLSILGVPLKKRSDAIKYKSHGNSALSVLLRRWDSGYTA